MSAVQRWFGARGAPAPAGAAGVRVRARAARDASAWATVAIGVAGEPHRQRAAVQADVR
jgi:hypothetical protein